MATIEALWQLVEARIAHLKGLSKLQLQGAQRALFAANSEYMSIVDILKTLPDGEKKQLSLASATQSLQMVDHATTDAIKKAAVREAKSSKVPVVGSHGQQRSARRPHPATSSQKTVVVGAPGSHKLP
ncbi:MAG: hypothetical protein A3H59_02075 [Candidatus Jacksonbacteria bacterium RIFCSPLOWO2_02_FULL_43_9]|nr:MAG: hypothetical protein UV70_C0005G0049 [Parcubacteria group bacterium GW2011_GWA2_43_13]OGY71381.1 MAG: hypothetical protein A2986_01480 [Candidatus Jacksonbacteria bacterium RIFCSPLOWO2_01_FULL_44_13]OGY72485.1 MAG: hypothetical protein A3H59_02075 [Candidatus Jacksonbacteria bacterium RIFCSPLOWO2_02_FULL_43_9]HAZ16514.1 hypothetical protein [Candidatus Jacksonbacteria bacterium]